MVAGSPGLVIRQATPEDALCISALGFQTFFNTYATAGIWPSLAREALAVFAIPVVEFHLKSPDLYFLVAEQDARMVGFAQLSHASDEWPEGALRLHHLYIQEPFTRKGIGKALLARAEALAREKGGTAISLTAWTDNARARAFYASQGYEDVGPSPFDFEGERYINRTFLKRLSPDPV